MAYVRSKRGKYEVRWKERVDGQWVDRSLTAPTRREAEAIRDEVGVALRRDGAYRPGRVRAHTGLEVMLVAYLDHCARTRAPRTVARYGQHLEVWSRFLRSRGRPSVADLSYLALSEFHAWLGQPVTGRHLHGRGAETVRKHVEAVELFWRWAFTRQQRGDWDGVPYPDSLELERAAPPARRAPTWEEMDACLAELRGWHRELGVILRCTGLRVSQALGLRWEDVDLDRRVGWVRPELGKSRQEKRGRHVALAPVLVEELAAWGTRDGYVVSCARMAREARARDLQRGWVRAGVLREVWEHRAHHAFRAGFESGLKRAGADDEAVEYLVGHSRGIREHYVSWDALPLVEAVGLVPPIGGESTVIAMPRRGEEG